MVGTLEWPEATGSSMTAPDALASSWSQQIIKALRHIFEFVRPSMRRIFESAERIFERGVQRDGGLRRGAQNSGDCLQTITLRLSSS